MTRKQLLQLAAKRKLQSKISGRIPDTEGYQTGLAAINRNLAVTNAGLAGQEQQLGQSYGITDPSDPFSRQALLRQHYEQARSVASQSLAARGQLYSGAQANAANSQRLNYEQGQAGLTREYQGGLANIAQRRSQAGATAGLARADLLRQSLQSTLNSPASAVPAKINRAQLIRMARKMHLR